MRVGPGGTITPAAMTPELERAVRASGGPSDAECASEFSNTELIGGQRATITSSGCGTFHATKAEWRALDFHFFGRSSTALAEQQVLSVIRSVRFTVRLRPPSN